ncbi:MAG: hypothetical protein LUC35_00255 [Clostridiales bacterium]|nr:hypothetical protein [Clostridiales bacterium]
MEVWDWTIGEIVEQVQAKTERDRREHQQQAAIAYRQAELTAMAVRGGKQLPDLWEAFPFWTDEETKNMLVAKYKARMERWAASGKKGGE